MSAYFSGPNILKDLFTIRLHKKQALVQCVWRFYNSFRMSSEHKSVINEIGCSVCA